MAQAHEETAAELHAAVEVLGDSKHPHDLAGAELRETSTPEKSVDVEFGITADDNEPNEYEKATLRRIGENLPASSFLIAVVELCERFTYYGAQGLFQNYISNDTQGLDGAVGLGLGHEAATGLNVFFQFFCYLTPIFGAIVADQYLGKYKTIIVFATVYWIGLIILWATALPVGLAHGAALPGYIVAIVVIGLGTGGIKTTIAPLIADQYQRRTMAIKTLPKTGERVIIDPAITYQRIYMIFYTCINVGSLSLLATPFMEEYIGFWSAYLLCFGMFCVGIVVLVVCRKAYVVRPPQGSIITDSIKAVGLMIVARNMDAPKPSWRAAHGKTKEVKWDDHFIDELKRALTACKVFAFYPVFWVCYGQFSTNFISQAAQMAGHGMPNDLMQNFDPIAIIVFVPILDRLVYPQLRRWHIELRPILRISIGFFFAGLCTAYAAIVQHLIYSAGPCYGAPLNCAAGTAPDGSPIPNNVHIVVQTPAYVFIGLSEIFLNVTGLEYAYTKAPPSMKSFVQALYLFTNAIGSALAEALVPATGDPAIMWMYTGIAATAGITSFVFYGLFRHLDALEEEMNALDRDVPTLKSKAQIEAEQREAEQRGAE